MQFQHSKNALRTSGFFFVIGFLFHINSWSQSNLIFYGGNGDGNSSICLAVPVVLPITLRSLECYCNDQAIIVEWVTESEINTERFEIEQSYDGIAWRKIAELPAAGRSSKPISYSVKLNISISGLAYTRLKTIDKNGGGVQISKIVLMQPCSKWDVDIYPNPNSGILNVSSHNSRVSVVEVYSTLGIRLMKFENIYNGVIDINPLSSGIYFINVISDKGEKWMKMEKL